MGSSKVHVVPDLLFSVCSWFSAVLGAVDWPHTDIKTTQQLDSWNVHFSNFSQLFSNLLKLNATPLADGDSPSPAAPVDEVSPSPAAGVVPPAPTTVEVPPPTTLLGDLPLPLELMVLPLRKRFRYHFREERKTNNIEKVSSQHLLIPETVFCLY